MTAVTFTGVNPHGREVTGGFTAADLVDVASWVQRCHDTGWAKLMVRGPGGGQIAGIYLDHESGERTWWADTGVTA